MFRNGKADIMDMWIMDQEERKSDLERVARFIVHNYSYGAIDIDDIAAECGVYDLNEAECDYIERKINAKW